MRLHPCADNSNKATYARVHCTPAHTNVRLVHFQFTYRAGRSARMVEFPSLFSFQIGIQIFQYGRSAPTSLVCPATPLLPEQFDGGSACTVSQVRIKCSMDTCNLNTINTNKNVILFVHRKLVISSIS